MDLKYMQTDNTRISKNMQKHTFPTENEKITAQSMTVAHGQINVQSKHNCL